MEGERAGEIVRSLTGLMGAWWEIQTHEFNDLANRVWLWYFGGGGGVRISAVLSIEIFHLILL